MYCAACGGRIETDDDRCAGCGADLRAPGAVRFTSSVEDDTRLHDVFPEHQPPAEWFDDPVETRTTPRNAPPRDRMRLVALPDPDAVGSRRVLTGIVLAVCLLLAGGVVLAIRWAQHVIDAPFAEARVAASSAAASASASRAAASRAATTPATPKDRPLPQASSAEPSQEETGYRASSLPPAAKQCSPFVGANSKTSCGFAKVVADALPDKPKDSFTLKATSPVTGQAYTLNCTAGQMVVCSGGQSVQVYVLY